MWRQLCDETAVKAAYGDLLLRWGLYMERSELLLKSNSQYPAGYVESDMAHGSLSKELFSAPESRVAD